MRLCLLKESMWPTRTRRGAGRGRPRTELRLAWSLLYWSGKGLGAPKLCSSPECFCDMDLEVADAVILLGPMVRVFVALWPVPFGMGWCFTARGVLSLLCVRCCWRRARGVPRRRPGRAPSLSCWCCPSWLFRRLRWVVAGARGGCGLPRFVPGPRSSLVLPLADLALLVEFVAVSLGPAVFAAFSELRGCSPGGEICGM